MNRERAGTRGRFDRGMRRRILGASTAGVLLISMAGCAGSTQEASTSVSNPAASATATSGSDSTSAAATANTELSSGSVTVTVGDKQITYTAAYLVDGIDATISGGTYASTSADEVVFLVVNGGSLTVSDATVDKSGDATSSDSQRTSDVSDDYNFYGMNSAIVVVGNGSTVSVGGTTITTTSSGSNAVVAVDEGSATVSDTTIRTSGNSARGLHATYGGTIEASDMAIATQGAHCADVATDRGGGTVTVTGTNSFSTEGDGSPLIYSTGDISVDGMTGTSSSSQAIVVEGKNSVTLTNSEVTSAGSDAVMIYQSMSGDAADQDSAGSVGTVAIEDTAITYTGDGPVLYFTNTTAKLALTNITVDSDATVLASAAEDRWGNSGSNGADVTLTVSGSQLTGDVDAGDSSTITVSLTDGATIDGQTSGSVTMS